MVLIKLKAVGLVVRMFCLTALGANSDGWLSGTCSGTEGNCCQFIYIVITSKKICFPTLTVQKGKSLDGMSYRNTNHQFISFSYIIHENFSFPS